MITEASRFVLRMSTGSCWTASRSAPKRFRAVVTVIVFICPSNRQDWASAAAVARLTNECVRPTWFEALPSVFFITLLSCYTVFVPTKSRLRNVTVTLEEDVAQWARIEAARRDTSVSRLLGELLKERMGKHGQSSVAEAVHRLSSFGKRHRLSVGGIKIKDLIDEGRR
jgi:hypothetical protein